MVLRNTVETKTAKQSQLGHFIALFSSCRAFLYIIIRCVIMLSIILFSINYVDDFWQSSWGGLLPAV